ncbi:hypothetical protein ES702_03811 [subsurface metagenome]
MDNETFKKCHRLISKIGGLTSARNTILRKAEKRAGEYTERIRELRLQLESLEIQIKSSN